MGGHGRARDRRFDRGADRAATPTLAQRVIALDRDIDALQREIEEKAVLTIARRQPMAQSICARSSARCASPTTSSGSATSPRTSPSASARSTASSSRTKLMRGVEHMAALVLRPAQGGARRLCRPRSCQRRWRCGSGDEEIDALYTSLFRELLTYMMEDPRNITLLHASAVLRQEHRAHGRPRHQHRRDRATI